MGEAAPIKKSRFSRPDRNLVRTEKTIALAYLKGSLIQTSHIECTSPARFEIQYKYVCGLSLSKEAI